MIRAASAIALVAVAGSSLVADSQDVGIQIVSLDAQTTIRVLLERKPIYEGKPELAPFHGMQAPLPVVAGKVSADSAGAAYDHRRGVGYGFEGAVRVESAGRPKSLGRHSLLPRPRRTQGTGLFHLCAAISSLPAQMISLKFSPYILAVPLSCCEYSVAILSGSSDQVFKLT